MRLQRLLLQLHTGDTDLRCQPHRATVSQLLTYQVGSNMNESLWEDHAHQLAHHSPGPHCVQRNVSRTEQLSGPSKNLLFAYVVHVAAHKLAGKEVRTA